MEHKNGPDFHAADISLFVLIVGGVIGWLTGIGALLGAGALGSSMAMLRVALVRN